MLRTRRRVITSRLRGEGRLGALPARPQAPSPGARDGDKGTDMRSVTAAWGPRPTLQDKEGLQTEGGCS